MAETIENLWQRVHELLGIHQYEAARIVLESILAIDPASAAGHLHLCGIHSHADRQQAASAEALKAADCVPNDLGVLGDVVAALLWVGEIVAARKLLDSPLIDASNSVPELFRAAGQWQAIGEHGKALALMNRAQAAGANGRDYLFHHGVQLAFNGMLDASRAELEQCITMDPPLGRAFVQLARMRKQTLQSNHLERIERASRLLHPESLERAALEFARFEELNDLCQHEDAWHALTYANAIMCKLLPHDSVAEAARISELIRVCTRDFLNGAPHQIDAGPQPIFVIGLPRSGTTLLERLLGSHSRIASAGELGDFPRALTLATDHLAPMLFDGVTLARMHRLDWSTVGDLYLQQTRWRAGSKTFFVDKLPRNWMLAGLIHLALPAAKILHVCRDPMDVCFSNWRAFFGPGPEYSYAYDLQALAFHYQQYRRLMKHWQATMPERIFDVSYSNLVDHPEKVMRDVLKFCGLKYEPACVDLAGNTRPSATLSMQQVRQAIHSGVPSQWKPYAQQLAGLRGAIGTGAID